MKVRCKEKKKKIGLSPKESQTGNQKNEWAIQQANPF